MAAEMIHWIQSGQGESYNTKDIQLNIHQELHFAALLCVCNGAMYIIWI